MASIRCRLLADGRERFDVHHHHDGRETTLTFDTYDEAEGFAHVWNLRRQRLWPLEPLTRLTGLTPNEFADRYGLGRSTVQTAARAGLTDIQADHWALAATYHPVNVWGWAWVSAADPAMSSSSELDVRGEVA